MGCEMSRHEHRLYPTPWVPHCNACNRRGGDNKDGYRCYECALVFHKRCAKPSLDIIHPAHPGHTLYLKNVEAVNDCKLCGEVLVDMHYQCHKCTFRIDTACAINPPPDVIEYPTTHEHALVISKDADSKRCDFCEATYIYSSRRYLYKCSKCQLKFHFECSNLSLETNYLHHPKHLIKLLKKEEPHFSDGECRICGNELGHKFYYCSICKFSVDIGCVINPPPLEFLFAKAHEHQLRLMSRKITFNCDVCGTKGNQSPYTCQECDFMIHQECIDLPEIINVNRHKHRIFRRIRLTPGFYKCTICEQNIDWSCGAYSCSICPNYAIHCKCATRDDIWDKIELKGKPEKHQEIQSFKTIRENIICHFSHEQHHLKLNEENIVCGGRICCAACISHVYFEAFYSCLQCDFILHKTCAELPRIQRHVYHDRQLTLRRNDDMTIFRCSACRSLSSGFFYQSTSLSFKIDVKCGALFEYIIHESHPCPLYLSIIHENRSCPRYFNHEVGKRCNVCQRFDNCAYRCKNCKFELDLKTTVLPTRTKHWYDEHLLSLCYENNMSIGDFLCDMCEEKLDIKTWFYKCHKCCVTLHIECVLGDFSLLKPGRLRIWITTFEVIQTNPGFIPRCSICSSHRPVPIVIFSPRDNMYFCSSLCLEKKYTIY